jgi:3-(3-hydroxy-phenyl)propionate hydroxylase/6-hydroxy-3-succinoylpyridine 3-monooxygenase
MGGLYDAFALSEALAAVVHGNASDDILDRYSELRRKVYHEVISPISSESLRLVFNSGDEDRLETDLALLRARKNDSEAMRKFLSAPAALETPSLVSGLTLTQRVAGS